MSKIKNENQQFYAYYDTIEETGEVIYCGKGTEKRSDPNKKHFRNSKYNKIKNKHKIIRTRIPTLDEDLALELEDWLMEHYHTWVDDLLCSEYACNINGPGTNGGNKSLSKETRNKISQKNRGKKHIGVKHTKETCELYSKIRKGRKCSEIHIKNNNLTKLKPVKQIDMITHVVVNIFNSINDAYLQTNILNIGGCCNGKRNSAGGYFWEFVDNKSIQIHRRNKVNQFNKQMIKINNFKSASEAQKHTNVSKYHILMCCRGEREFAGDFIWQFDNE